MPHAYRSIAFARLSLRAVIWLLLSVVCLLAQGNNQDPSRQRPPGSPIGGPYMHRVESASSQDGLTFTLNRSTLLEHASVPATITLSDGRLRIYYVDASHAPETANVAESSDNGQTFRPLGLVITNRAKSKALDPSIARLPDGRWRLYYFACSMRPDEDGPHEIHAAISTDGVHFTEEQTAFARDGLVDPDVWWNGQEWLMFVFSGAERETIVARSKDGLNFEYAGALGLRGWGTVAPIKLDDGRFRMFAFRQGSQREIASFISTDGLKWTQEQGTRLSAPEGQEISDPFVVRLKDGSWKMFFKIEEHRAPPFGNRPPPDRGPSPINGPWNHDLVVFESSDGKSFAGSKTFVERGGVPCVIRDAKGRLAAVFQWFPFDRRDAFDKVAVVFSTDDGKTWTKPELIVVEGLPEGVQRPFDPTLALLDDGRLRLYFTCTTPARRTPGIYSAVSADGVRYKFEAGMRFGVDDEPTVDAAVTRLGQTWHLFSPVQGPENRGYHAVSDDGLNFHRLNNVTAPLRGSWIGNVISRDGELWFYGSGGEGGWLAHSKDGASWELLSTALRVGGDPSAAILKNGRYLIVATGGLRADAQAPPFRLR